MTVMENNNSRRSFLKNISLATFSALSLAGCNMKEIDEFLQKNFRTLSQEEKDEIVRNLELKYKKRYNKEFHVSNKPAMEGVSFGYALTLGKASLTTVILGVQPLFVFLLGVVLGPIIPSFHLEDTSRKALAFKGISFALVIGGLILLQSGSGL